MNFRPLLLAAAAAAISAAALAAEPATATSTAPQPLPSVDLKAYMGQWYQVALYPNRFQAQCVDSTTATYSLRPDGQVTVLNRCRTQDGWDDTEGLARPRDGAQVKDGQLAPARLEVSFLPRFIRWLPVGWGNYDLLLLGPNQQWAIVGEPTREYLWVLSRTPQLDAAQWLLVEAALRERGYELGRLKREPTPSVAPR